MKSKILSGAALWILLITTLHVQLNVGWGRLGHKIKVMLGQARAEMVVGFLPVT